MLLIGYVVAFQMSECKQDTWCATHVIASVHTRTPYPLADNGLRLFTACARCSDQSRSIASLPVSGTGWVCGMSLDVAHVLPIPATRFGFWSELHFMSLETFSPVQCTNQ